MNKIVVLSTKETHHCSRNSGKQVTRKIMRFMVAFVRLWQLLEV